MAVARNGYPIRLIQDNGNTIELMANRIDMNVTRKTGGKPMPWTGSSRYSFDMNINRAMITIQGVFVDDDTIISGTPGTAIMNFARTQNDYGTGFKWNAPQWGTGSNLQYLFHDEAPSSNKSPEILRPGNGQVMYHHRDAGRFFLPTAGLVKPAITLGSVTTNGGTFTHHIYFKSVIGGVNDTDTTAYDATASDPTVNVDFQGNHQITNYLHTSTLPTAYKGVTPTSLATAVAACINGKLSDYFSAVPIDVTDKNGSTVDDGGVQITQVNHGSGGYVRSTGLSTAHPTSKSPEYAKCYMETGYGFDAFVGASDASQKSAGDKVQDLWGIINNSIPSAKGSLIRTRGFKAMFSWDRGEEGGWLRAGRTQWANGDYIIGLQLPYNSMVQADSSELYVPRNFLVPVGKFKHGIVEGGPDNPFGNKGSEENNEPASVEFSKNGFTSGIQGTVTKFDVSYDAGENVYVFTMIFAPINRMW